MKKLSLTTVIFVFLLFLYNGIQGQTTQTKLDQLKINQAFVGTWQRTEGKDTVEGWDCQQHGNAFVENGYLIINGKKSFNYIETYGFSSKEGKFKGFALFPSGDYMTWLGIYTSEKKMVGDFVRDFNPKAVTGKFEVVFETPTSMAMTMFNAKGVKTAETKWFKVNLITH